MWSDLWPLVLTALLTLGVTLAVQFYAVPRVETRKRREDRWERDLLALGELLTFEQRAAADPFFHGLWLRHWLHSMQGEDDVDPDKIGAMLTEHDDELRQRATDYERLDSRVDWLADRVCAIDNYADGLRPFVKARHRYVAAQTKGHLFCILPMEDWPSREDIEKVRDAERLAVQSMVQAIKDLLGHPPPRTPVRTRTRQRIRHWLAPLSRRLAALKVQRENRQEQKAAGAR